jgi:hypothetical protein
VGCGVVKEVDGGFGGSLGALRLSGSKASKGHKHGIINGPSVVKKDTNNLLEASDFSFVKGGGGIRRGSELYLAAIDGF